MALETASGTVECPECFGEITVEDVMASEIVQCPECGAGFTAEHQGSCVVCLRCGYSRCA